MKKIILTTIISIAATFAFAQIPNISEPARRSTHLKWGIVTLPFDEGLPLEMNYDNPLKIFSADFSQSALRTSGEAIIRLDSLLYYETDSITGDLVLSKKKVYINSGNVYYIIYDWNTNNNTWVKYEKEERTYENGRLTLRLKFKWDTSTEQWISSGKGIIEYNTHGNLTNYENYYWDVVKNQWVGIYKNEFIYADERKSEFKKYTWDGDNDTWFLISHVKYFYNEDGIKTETITSIWQEDKNDWGQIKTEFTYDENNKLTVQLLYLLNPDNNQWEINTKIEWEYDENGILGMTTTYQWDDENGQWNGSYRNEYQNNTNGNLETQIVYVWDTLNNQWKNKEKTAYPKDEDDLLSDVIYYTWDPAKNDWCVTDKISYYYSKTEVITATGKLENEPIILYPNPANSFLRVELKQFSKQDNEQLKVKLISNNSREISVGNFMIMDDIFQLDVRGVPTGLYYLQIRSSTFQRTFKVLIKR